MSATRDKLIELLSKSTKVAIATDMYFYMDYLAIDTSDEDMVRLICKFNTNAKSILEPTFGSTITTTGLQEVILPYSKIYAIEAFECEEDILNKFKTEFPLAYKYYSEANSVEVAPVTASVPGVNDIVNNS